MSDIIGHERQKKILFRFSKTETVPHALLFCGPERVGKRSLALRFIEFISCLSDNPPCGNCINCKQIKRETYTDLSLVYPEDGEIRMSQIEGLIKKISLKSSSGGVKTVLIDDAHLMNHQAQNSLLKTLEEPSGNTVIILVTGYPSLLLPTITSRTFKLRFSFVAHKEISSYLKEKECSDEENITSLALGRPGLALDYFLNPEKMKEEKERRSTFIEMMKEDIPFRFLKVKEVITTEDVKEVITCWIKCLREEFLWKVKEKESVSEIGRVIKEMENAILLSTKTNANLQLALEKIMIKL